MKVIRKSPELRTLTLRIREHVMQRIDKIADENKVSRQKLVEAILIQVLEDKSFVLKLE